MTVDGDPPRVHALAAVPNVRLNAIILPRSSDLAELRTLNLEGNEFHGVVPVQLYNMANLRVLDLSRNGFEGPTPPELDRPEILEELHLEDNPPQGQIPPELSDLRDLRVLSLVGCRSQLTGTIAGELGNLENLRALGISHPAGIGTIRALPLTENYCLKTSYPLVPWQTDRVTFMPTT